MRANSFSRALLGSASLSRLNRYRIHRSCKKIATDATPPRRAALRGLPSDLKHNHDLFNFTNGRFIVDEAYEMTQRHVSFNVNELARVAANAVGAKICFNIVKYPDGMYNKAMLLTMDDGARVVAKVPNPNAGLPHFTTASEVAAMDFARNALGNPVPQIFAWSSKANNPVGAEYIIMEKVPGIGLERVWSSMDIRDKWSIVQNLVRYQETWSSISFKKYGGLYYAKYLNSPAENGPLYTNTNGADVTDSRFAIGPSAGRDWMDNRRSTLSIDRGPWTTAESFQAAVGHREIAAVNELPLPKSPIMLCGPGTYQPTREMKRKALDCHFTLLPFLLPEDKAICSSHLWHSDLHIGNIFVNPSNPTGIPYIIDYSGTPVLGIVRPRKPEQHPQLDTEAKKRAGVLYLEQSLFSLYNNLTCKQNPRLWFAFEFQQSISHFLLLVAGNILVDGEASYLSRVVELEKTWTEEIPGAKGHSYPFSFSASEREEIDVAHEGAARGMDAMRAVSNSMGAELFPLLGMVKHERHEEALHVLGQMIEKMIEIHGQSKEDREAWETEWPFGT